jgi:hypothetical protein
MYSKLTGYTHCNFTTLASGRGDKQDKGRGGDVNREDRRGVRGLSACSRVKVVVLDERRPGRQSSVGELRSHCR